MKFGLIDRHRPEARPGGPVRVEAGPERLGRDLTRTAQCYRPAPELVDAINVAVSVGAPLLLTGQPGTGKTQVAFYLKWYLEVDDDNFHVHPIRSTSVAEELTYTVDEVRYFQAAHIRRDEDVSRRGFLQPGPLWKAYRSHRQSIVLIDEIDKAPRDFPNDLLFVLDQGKFRVPEHEEATQDGAIMPVWIERAKGAPPPIIVITSNSERRLPDPFLRRCVFHHIRFTAELLRTAVRAHLERWPNLDGEVVDAALERSLEMGQRRLRKPPSTAEIILWLSVLDLMAAGGRDVRADTLRYTSLRDLPALSTLIKDADDVDRL